MKRELLLLGLMMSLPAAAAGIYKCTSPGGGITYQETPCDGAQSGGVSNIPTSFPEVNTAERERLLQQMALMQQRELKRYEIDSNERIAMADIASREKQAEMNRAAADDVYGGPVYGGAWAGARLIPIGGGQRQRPQHHNSSNSNSHQH